MLKRALLVGIDHYDDLPSLAGCSNDASALYPLLSRNEDASPSFDCRLKAVQQPSERLSRDQLLNMIDQLLGGGSSLALFYFAGHGFPSRGGGVALATSDGTPTTPGVDFFEILSRINDSQVPEVTVILDCCFSGGAGTMESLNSGLVNLRKGLAVLTASRDDQEALESVDRRGQFSGYLEGALDAGAADVLGHVNVSGLYAYLSESFGAWDQRPTFKANIDRLQDIRTCYPRVPLTTLRMIIEWFEDPRDIYPLDPTYEPTAEPIGHANEAIFSGLQKLRACRLVEPVGEEHMYYAAMNSTGCKLTALGLHYWRLAKAGRI